MKKLLMRQGSMLLFGLLLLVIAVQQTRAQEVQVSYQTFYDELSPYGQWVSDPQYGNVWIPNVDGGFRPYATNGYWAMTDYGNTWVSDYPWGWACYHYGRWTYDPYYGWLWIPGYEWAPAWVSWRYGGGYCGWAPLGPGVAIGVGGCPDSWWVFVPPAYMFRHDWYHQWRGPAHNGNYIRQTTILNNAYVDNGTHVRYNFGPRADAIERDTHQPVQVYHVSPAGKPGAPGISGHNLNIYRPAVNKATVSAAHPANVIAAPRQIGKPQEAKNLNASHQPAFRQQVQQVAHTGGNAQNGSGNVNHKPQANRPQQHQQSQGRPQANPQQRQQPQARPKPLPQQHQVPQSRPQPAPQQHHPPQRPQPMPQAPHGAPPHQEAPRGGGNERR